MYRVIGLDISSIASGWSVLDLVDGQTILTDYGVINPPETLNQTATFGYITDSIGILLKAFQPNDLVIEDTFFGKDVTVLKKLSRIAGQLQYIWWSKQRKEPFFYMAMTARKDFPGLQGNSKKPEIVVAVNKQFNLRIKDHNIADAIVVAHHHLINLDDTPKITIFKNPVKSTSGGTGVMPPIELPPLNYKEKKRKKGLTNE